MCEREGSAGRRESVRERGREWEWEWRTERKGRSGSEEERETNRGGGIEGGRKGERERKRGERECIIRMYYGRLQNKKLIINVFFIITKYYTMQ